MSYFAIAFRAFAFLFSVCGILAFMGVFKHPLKKVRLLTYTGQSNILTALYFGVLLTKTIAKILGKVNWPVSAVKPYGFFPRVSALVALTIFVTLIVFWVILVPFEKPGRKFRDFLVFDNLAVHLFNPLLMLLDYLIFTERGILKLWDPLWCIIIPVIYLLQVIPLGLARKVRYDSIDYPSYYPYFFLDIDKLGKWRVTVWVAVLMAFFLILAFTWRFVDKFLA